MSADGFCSESRPLVIPSGWSMMDVKAWRRIARDACPNCSADRYMIEMQRVSQGVDVLWCGSVNCSHIDYAGWFHIMALQPVIFYIKPMTLDEAKEKSRENDLISAYGEGNVCPLRRMSRIRLSAGDIIQFNGIVPHTARSSQVMWFLGTDTSGSQPRPSRDWVVQKFAKINTGLKEAA